MFGRAVIASALIALAVGSAAIPASKSTPATEAQAQDIISYYYTLRSFAVNLTIELEVHSLTDSLEALISALEYADGLIAEAEAALAAGNYTEAVELATEAVNTLGEAVSEAVSALWELNSDWYSQAELEDVTSGLEALKDLIEQLADVAKALNEKEALTALENATAMIELALEEIAAGTNLTADQLDELLESISEQVDEALDALEEAGEEIHETMVEEFLEELDEEELNETVECLEEVVQMAESMNDTEALIWLKDVIEMMINQSENATRGEDVEDAMSPILEEIYDALGIEIENETAAPETCCMEEYEELEDNETLKTELSEEEGEELEPEEGIEEETGMEEEAPTEGETGEEGMWGEGTEDQGWFGEEQGWISDDEESVGLIAAQATNLF